MYKEHIENLPDYFLILPQWYLFLSHILLHISVYLYKHIFFFTTFLRVSFIVMSSKLHSSSRVGFFFFFFSVKTDRWLNEQCSFFSLFFEKLPPYIYIMNLVSSNKNNGLPSCIIYPQITSIKSTHIHTTSLCPDRRNPEGQCGLMVNAQ